LSTVRFAQESLAVNSIILSLKDIKPRQAGLEISTNNPLERHKMTSPIDRIEVEKVGFDDVEDESRRIESGRMDPELTRSLLRKLDRTLVPWVSFLCTSIFEHSK